MGYNHLIPGMKGFGACGDGASWYIAPDKLGMDVNYES